jgi:hypothetical protein
VYFCPKYIPKKVPTTSKLDKSVNPMSSLCRKVFGTFPEFCIAADYLMFATHLMNRRGILVYILELSVK